MSVFTRAFLTIALAVIIALSLLFFAREDCPPGQQWVLSDSLWVCK